MCAVWAACQGWAVTSVSGAPDLNIHARATQKATDLVFAVAAVEHRIIENDGVVAAAEKYPLIKIYMVVATESAEGFVSCKVPRGVVSIGADADPPMKSMGSNPAASRCASQSATDGPPLAPARTATNPTNTNTTNSTPLRVKALTRPPSPISQTHTAAAEPADHNQYSSSHALRSRPELCCCVSQSASRDPNGRRYMVRVPDL